VDPLVIRAWPTRNPAAHGDVRAIPVDEALGGAPAVRWGSLDTGVAATEEFVDSW
jgi:hypothetical protein